MKTIIFKNLKVSQQIYAISQCNGSQIVTHVQLIMRRIYFSFVALANFNNQSKLFFIVMIFGKNFSLFEDLNF